MFVYWTDSEAGMTPGSKWKHFKGGTYKLLGCCRLESSKEPHVVYKEWGDGTDYGQWWVRPLSEWQELVHAKTGTVDPVTVPRFALVEEKP